MSSRHDEEAALGAVDRDRTLPGEDFDTDRLEDAELWVRVYSELLDFKLSLLRAGDEAMERMAAPAREEIAATDQAIMRVEAARFERRLAHWRRRCEALSGGG